MITPKDLLVSAARNLRNIQGWSSAERIVVLESDDWGSIRVPSASVRAEFERMNFPSHCWSYNRLDSLESNTDLEALFEVLEKHRDRNGRPATMTANVIVGNPDFEKIQRSGFQQYDWESIQATASHYPQHDRILSLYHQGMNAGIFHPQLHGREHLQVSRWMNALQQPDSSTRKTFNFQSTYSGVDDYSYMEAFDEDDSDESIRLTSILREGAEEFRRLFGFHSKSFIAPCYTWSEAVERVMPSCGIKYVQGASAQLVPKGGFGNYVKKKSSLGLHRKSSTVSLVRNCFFEPSLVMKSNWVSYTLQSVADAFRWGKPAVVCSHRVNYIGFIEERNRKENLQLLDEFLGKLLRRWPTIRFMTSDQLGDYITNTDRHE